MATAAALKTGQIRGWQVKGLSPEPAIAAVSRADNRSGLVAENPAATPATIIRPGKPCCPKNGSLACRRAAFPEARGSQRQHLYYVMREYSGSTLAQLFQQAARCRWPSGRTAERLLRAVGLLHRRQILHRDIKPENLHAGGRRRVTRCWISVWRIAPVCPKTRRQRCPEPSYIAPEAFRGEPPSAQQDLYAVGVTLYFLLTGHFPYGEIEAFQRPRFGVPVSAGRYRPDLPEWLRKSERGWLRIRNSALKRLKNGCWCWNRASAAV
jgi:serine/threonine protein kinase